MTKSKRSRLRSLAALYGAAVGCAEVIAKKARLTQSELEQRIRKLEDENRRLRKHSEFVEKKLRQLSQNPELTKTLRQHCLFRQQTP
jgi:cell division protein FtsB